MFEKLLVFVSGLLQILTALSYFQWILYGLYALTVIAFLVQGAFWTALFAFVAGFLTYDKYFTTK